VVLWWYPRFLRATPEQRARFEIGRIGIHWPEIDEDIEFAGLLLEPKRPTPSRRSKREGHASPYSTRRLDRI